MAKSVRYAFRPFIGYALPLQTMLRQRAEPLLYHLEQPTGHQLKADTHSREVAISSWLTQR